MSESKQTEILHLRTSIHNLILSLDSLKVFQSLKKDIKEDSIVFYNYNSIHSTSERSFYYQSNILLFFI